MTCAVSPGATESGPAMSTRIGTGADGGGGGGGDCETGVLGAVGGFRSQPRTAAVSSRRTSPT